MTNPYMGKKVLLGVLDWGLGHATRSSVIIKEIIRQGHTPKVLSAGEALHWIQAEFPEIETITVPSLSMRYYPLLGALISAALHTPRLFWLMHIERKMVDQIVRQEKIDLIISDNRYGCYHREVKSVLVCHFLNILLPRGWKIFNPLLNFFYRAILRKFNEIWVPDDEANEGGRLSGKLSELNVEKYFLKFIGPLSRFEQAEPKSNKIFDVTAIISGPEPLRSQFAKKVFSSLSEFPGRRLVVVGGTELQVSRGEEIELRYNVSSTELGEIIQSTKLIISRSGYSSIMDYDRLRAKVLMVPTPGQPEQIYLAQFTALKGYATCVQEEVLTAGLIATNINSSMEFIGSFASDCLEKQISEALK